MLPNLWGKERFNDEVLKFGTDGYGEEKVSKESSMSHKIAQSLQ